MVVAIDTERPIASPSDSVQRDRERTRPARGPAPPGSNGRANGVPSLPQPHAVAPPGSNGRANGVPSLPQPHAVGLTAEATTDGQRDIALADVGGARLLVSDVRVALLLLDEARHRAVKRLFGVSRDQSWAVTLIALAALAQAAHEKSDQMLRGPGGPTRADVALGAAALRELLAWIPGPSSRDTPLVGTLVMIAVVGAGVRPGLSRTAHGIRTSSHRARQSFNHRYGHLLPARGEQRCGEKVR